MGVIHHLFLYSLFVIFSVATAQLIDVPAADKKDKADREDLACHIDPLLHLNRFTFHKSLFEEHDNEVAHWVVLFCPTWYEPCQFLQPIYRRLSEHWQGRLNNALLSAEVRFASVDCATEKALCNTQDVGMHYPTVVHYHNHQKVARWRGKTFESDEKRIKDWLQKELGHMSGTIMIDPDAEVSEADSAENQYQVPIDFLLIFIAIVGNAWFIGRGGFCGEASAAKPASKTGASFTTASAPVGPESPTSCIQPSWQKESGQQPLEL